MKDISKLYEKLSKDERTILFFEAASRHDVEELDRLNDTCEQKTYRGEDWNYTRKKLHMMNAAQMYKIGNDRAIIGALTALVGFLSHNDDKGIDCFAETILKCLAIYKGRVIAWSKICDQLGIESETLNKATGIDDYFPAEFLLGLELDVDSDPQAEKNCFELLNDLIQ